MGTHAVAVIAVIRIDAAANVGGLALAAFAGPTAWEVVASVVCPFTQIRFADDDEPGLDELVDEIGIRGWSHTMQRPRTASRLHSELRNRCDVVLDHNGDPMQTSPDLAILSLLIKRLRSLSQLIFGHHTQHRMKVLIMLLDHLKALLYKINTGEVPIRQSGGEGFSVNSEQIGQSATLRKKGHHLTEICPGEHDVESKGEERNEGDEM